MKLHGIDVSHHQAPSQLPWESIGKTSQFCIVRATYGTMRDKLAAEHVRRARGVGLKVGLYHFFRPGQEVEDQLGMFGEMCASCDLRDGDIVPVVDVERDGTHGPEPAPEWNGRLQPLCAELGRQWGTPLIYTTQRDWSQLGRPEWLLQHPLWVAHWTVGAQPATPGNRPWTMWQYRVGRYQPGGKGGVYDQGEAQLDHNWAMELPLIQGEVEPAPDTERNPGAEALALANAAEHAVDVVRDESEDER